MSLPRTNTMYQRYKPPSPRANQKDLCDEENESVRVYVRVRPFNGAEIAMSKEKNEPLRSIVQTRGSKVTLLDHENDYVEKDAMVFDDSFWSIPPEQQRHTAQDFATQELVYSRCGTPLVNNMFDGYNSCIFAYGQTGSGKTHTMMGYSADTGLIPRLCHSLFDRIETDKAMNPNRRYDMVVMFFEIYNEKVKDLFQKNKEQDYQGLKVRNHPITGPYVEGLEAKKVFSAADCLRLIERGAANRTTKSTGMNDTSSRSHAIFKIEFTQTDEEIDDEGNPLPLTRVSQMNLVDLAGSERVKKSLVTADQLIEATNINQSLTTLRKVIDALIDQSKGKKTVPPYRESMLTWVLSESLGGNSKTVMIAAVSPHFNNEEETHSTLRYALRAKSIVNKVRVNENKSTRMLREMKEQMAAMQRKIAEGDVGENAEIKAELKKQIEAKKEEMHEWQEKEKEASRQTEELVKLLEKEKQFADQLASSVNKLNENTQETRVQLQAQKNTQFSAAFKNAFTLVKTSKGFDRGCTEIKQVINDLQRKVIAQEALERQTQEEIEVYIEQQQRYEAQDKKISAGLALNKSEVQRLSQHIEKFETSIAEINREATHAVVMTSSRVESLTEQLGELERNRQVTLASNERAVAEVKQHEALMTSTTQEGEAKIRVLEQQMVQLEQSVSQKSTVLAELMPQCSQYERSVAAITQKLEALNSQRTQVNDDYRKEKAALGRECAAVKQSFLFDRTKCIGHLDEGMAILSDIKKIITSAVPKPSPNEVRTGRQRVLGFLAGLNLERHIADFDRQGFTDLDSIIYMTEVDLQDMRIIGGDRRKLLSAASELRIAQTGGVMQGAAASLDVSKQNTLELIGEIERWLRDTWIVMSNVSERITPLST